MNLTNIQRKRIDEFIFTDLAKKDWTREQRDYSYGKWKGRRTWGITHQGGTGILLMLCWYHHIYKKNSNEWRPAIIIAALCSYLKI